MSTRIQEVRITLTWFERLINIWDLDSKIGMPFLKSPVDYAEKFKSVRVDGGGEALTHPWPSEEDKYRHWFWMYYLQPSSPQQLSGKEALHRLVPLRSGFGAKIQCEKNWIVTIPDAFFYPHGIGLVITLKIYLDREPWQRSGVSLETAVGKAIESWQEYQYHLDWSGGGNEIGGLDFVRRRLMKRLRERVLSPGCEEGRGDLQPFTVAAIVRGHFDRPEDATTLGQDWQHAMQGLCNLRKPWQKVTLYPMQEGLLRIRRSVPTNHRLYHSERGRAIWFPSSFTDTDKRRMRVVGCYQRNLTLLHLQTTAMIEVLRSQADLVAAGFTVPLMLSNLAAEASRQLSLLYSSVKDTYRSSSPRAYIDENQVLKNIIEKSLGQKLEFKETPT